MDSFVPLLPDDKPVPLPFQFLAYKYNFLWPQSEHVAVLKYGLKQLAVTISVLCYVGTLLGEAQFMSEHFGDIPALADCFSTSLMGSQYIIRICIIASRQQEMRALLQRFYKQIFFTPDERSQFYKEIKIITHFTDFCTKIYYIPMFIIIGMYVADVLRQDMSSQDKPYIYRMAFRWYDAQSPPLYILTGLYTSWLTVSCVSMMSAEDFMLCLMLCHTSYRYKELRKELRHMLQNARDELNCSKTQSCGDLHDVFRRKLYDVFKRQQKLNSFVDEAKAHFTHQIFYCMGFGVLQLCMVCFLFQRTPIGIIWVKYIIWLISQTAQFIMIGYFGQMLMDETSAMFNSYYMCQWEDLLPHGNVRSNKLLMGDITFALLNAERAVAFHGMKMFPLTHSTVGAALRSAMSYFMFLNTMNDANKAK